MNSLYVTLFLHVPELICFLTDKWFPVMLFHTNNYVYL